MTILRCEISDVLKKKINKLVELRNPIVHYRPDRWRIDEDSLGIMGEIKQLDFKDYIGTVDELQNELSSLLERLNPNHQLAKFIELKLAGDNINPFRR